MWLDSLSAHIQANSLGTEGTDLFHGIMPDDDGGASVMVGLQIEPGTVAFTGAPGIAYEQPTLQVGVRAADWSAAWDRITAIRNLLATIANQTVQGTHFLAVMPNGTIEDYERDGRDRQQFVASFDVTF